MASVLSVEGPKSALEASDWVISRGCVPSGELKGLQAVLHVGLKQWDEAQLLVDEEPDDSFRRIEIVEILLDWIAGDKDICPLITTLNSPEKLFEQLFILSPLDVKEMSHLPCFADSILQMDPTRASYE